MSGTQRRAVAGGFGVLLALAVGACGSSGGSSSGGGSGTTSSSPTKVTLIVPSLSSNQSLAFLAQGFGTFKKNNLDVKTVVSGTGALAVAGAISGSGQFVMSGGSDMLSAVSKGQKLVFLTRCLGGGLASQLVLTNAAAKKTGLPASATPAQKAKALNGLTIASPSAASSQTTQAERAAASVGRQRRTLSNTSDLLNRSCRNTAVPGSMARSVRGVAWRSQMSNCSRSCSTWSALK